MRCISCGAPASKALVTPNTSSLAHVPNMVRLSACFFSTQSSPPALFQSSRCMLKLYKPPQSLQGHLKAVLSPTLSLQTLPERSARLPYNVVIYLSIHHPPSSSFYKLADPRISSLGASQSISTFVCGCAHTHLQESGSIPMHDLLPSEFS